MHRKKDFFSVFFLRSFKQLLRIAYILHVLMYLFCLFLFFLLNRTVLMLVKFTNNDELLFDIIKEIKKIKEK